MSSSSSSPIELISFSICPFVHRSTTLLHLQKRPFKLTTIDLSNKPDWFLAISPLGKVPTLRTEAGTLFESLAIAEYLDETAEAKDQLAPWSDPWLRAQNNAMISYLGGFFGDQHTSLFASEEDELAKSRSSFADKVAYLTKAGCIKGDFFNGHKISLIDVAVAPAFYRHALVEAVTGTPAFDRAANQAFAQWFDRLASLPEVVAGVASTLGLDPTTPKDEVDVAFRAAVKAFLEKRCPNSLVASKL